MLTARFVLHLRELSDVDVTIITGGTAGGSKSQQVPQRSHRDIEMESYGTGSGVSFAPYVREDDEEMEMSVIHSPPQSPHKVVDFQSYRIRQPEW